MAETNLLPNYNELEIPAHTTPESEMHHEEFQEEPKRHKWLIPVVIVLVLVILFGFGIFFAYRYLFAQTQDPNSTIGAAWLDIHTQPDSDPDEDGLSNAEEMKYGTNFWQKDTDGDGFPDGDEANHGYNPTGPGKLSDSKLDFNSLGF